MLDQQVAVYRSSASSPDLLLEAMGDIHGPEKPPGRQIGGYCLELEGVASQPVCLSTLEHEGVCLDGSGLTSGRKEVIARVYNAPQLFRNG